LLVVVSVLCFGGRASAQTVPTLPDPGTILPLGQLAPVLELVGPATSPVCGGVGIVVFLSPPLLAGLGPVGGVALSALGPVLTLCGAIPSTGNDERYTCALDDQSQAALAKVLIPLAGIGPVVDVRPAGLPLDQLQVIVDRLPPQFGLQQLLTQTTTVLQCRQGGPKEDEPTTTVPRTTPPGAAPSDPTPFVLPVADVLDLPDVSVAGPAVVSPVPGRPTATTRLVPRVPFSYAGIFLLPFAMFAALAWFGRGMTRPLRDLGDGTTD
jgi:hypothetical protein